jgi:N-acetylmuramoyl-L-alanine amidase
MLTRTNDTFVELENRPSFTNRKKAGLFIRLHFNIGAPGDARVVKDFPGVWRENLVEAAAKFRSSLPVRHWDEDAFRVPMMTRVDEALEDMRSQTSKLAGSASALSNPLAGRKFPLLTYILRAKPPMPPLAGDDTRWPFLAQTTRCHRPLRGHQFFLAVAQALSTSPCCRQCEGVSS